MGTVLAGTSPTIAVHPVTFDEDGSGRQADLDGPQDIHDLAQFDALPDQ